MTRKKEERKVKNAKRKIWLKAGIYPDFRGLCDRSGKCVEIPVHVVAEGERGVTVVQEFHVVDEVERFVVLGDV